MIVRKFETLIIAEIMACMVEKARPNAARSGAGRANAWLRSLKATLPAIEKSAIENYERKMEIRKQRHVLRLLPLSPTPLSLQPVASPSATSPPRPPPLPVVLHLLLPATPIAAAQSPTRARAAAIRTPIMNQTTTILGTPLRGGGRCCSYSSTA